MNEVEVKVVVYEINGREPPACYERDLTVKSHWPRSNMVVISIGKDSVTVLGRDLRAAIESATREY